MSGGKRRPCGPVRQLSLQPTSSPPAYHQGGVSSASRRHQLRKQSSEDIWHSDGAGTLGVYANSIHSLAGVPPPRAAAASASASRPRPPPARLAWTEQRARHSAVSAGHNHHAEAPSQPPKVEVEVVARKCTLPQARTKPPPKTVTQEALDGSRLRLAERLRLAWQQSAPARTNLDIFLAHNSHLHSPAAAAANLDNQVIADVCEESSTMVSAQNPFPVAVDEEDDDEGEEKSEKLIDSREVVLKSGTEKRENDELGSTSKMNELYGMSEDSKIAQEDKENEKGKRSRAEQRGGKSICISITDSRDVSELSYCGLTVEEEDENEHEYGRRKFKDDEQGSDLEVDNLERTVEQRSKNFSNRNKNGGGRGSSLRHVTSSPDLLAKKSEISSTTVSASRSSTPGGQGRQDLTTTRRLMSAPPQSHQRRPPSQQGTQQEKVSPVAQQARRKLKSARRKQQQRPPGDEEDISSGEDIEQKPRRSRSARTSEVITMVSLLSPGQSEQEEEDCVPMVLGATSAVSDQHVTWQESCQVPKIVSNNSCFTKSNPSVGANTPFLNGSSTSNPILCIRKPVKTVSFQQQAGARSYANNFPSRRGAAVLPEESNNPAPPVLRSTSLVAANSIKETNPVLKRKLVRARSSNEPATMPMVSNEEEEEDKLPAGPSLVQPISISLTGKNTVDDNKNERAFIESKDRNKLVEEQENEKEDSEDVPELKTPKEQECWDLFRRMVDKGITVSFETVLRGMLTPTEYRLRRHDLLTS